MGDRTSPALPTQFLSAQPRWAARLAWLRSYAAVSAINWQILDASTPGDVEKLARSTPISYRDALTSLRLVDPVDAWTPGDSAFTRLAWSPEHYLAKTEIGSDRAT